MSCDRLVFYRFHIAISYAGEMLKLEGPPHHPLLRHKHVCTSTYDRPDFCFEISVTKKFQMQDKQFTSDMDTLSPIIMVQCMAVFEW